MKLRRLEIAGFGRLVDRRFTFADGLTVVYGPNEAGKSTVARSIVAALYGLPRQREQWRPWNGAAFATALTYELDDGRTFEVRRDFARDARSIRLYDANGNDVAASAADGRAVAPGETHLQLPYEAFVNGACVLQQNVEIDGTRSVAATIATALARALDGGPKEDAALGALARLDEARRTLVGTPRATVNNPLRSAREALTARERDAQQAAAQRDRLAQTRERRAAAIAERDRLAERRAAAEHDARAVRLADLRARLDDLRVYREELDARRVERAKYDDVAGFPADRVGALERAVAAWEAADAARVAAEAAADDARLAPDERAEWLARRADVGTIDEAEVAAVRLAADHAEAARAKSVAAAGEAAAARRSGESAPGIAGAMLAVAAAFGLLTVAFAIAHWWSFTEVCGLVAAIAFAVVGLRARERARAVRAAAEKQRVADESMAAEQAATAAVVTVLERHGVASLDELLRRRDRLADLGRRAAAAQRAFERAEDAAHRAEAGAGEVDALLEAIVPDVRGSRHERFGVARERAQRRRERDGVESGLAMLEIRRGEILRGDDEFALVAERDALVAAGIVPLDVSARAAADEAVARLAELGRLLRDAEMAVAQLTGELDAGEAAIPDLAALEEAVALARADVERLDALDRAFKLATETLSRITQEAHQAFARRLETYAAADLATVTGGRYGEIFVDPATLAVRVRVPETGAIESLDVLSSGTRDQIYLVVRFAMARMFAEGLEQPPLLLDDPFAFWDERRIERCLPLIAQNAFSTQTVLFTASRELADAARAIGATRLDLEAPAYAAS